MKDAPKPDKRRKDDAALRAAALRPAKRSCLTEAAARALNIDPKRLYQWPKAAQTPVAAANRRQAQELGILKKAIASACF